MILFLPGLKAFLKISFIFENKVLKKISYEARPMDELIVRIKVNSSNDISGWKNLDDTLHTLHEQVRELIIVEIFRAQKAKDTPKPAKSSDTSR